MSQRNVDAELDADLLTMRTDKVSLGIIPHDLISFILEKPGDFCISANSMGSYELSIRSDKDKTFHLALEPIVKGYRIRSMLFATGATIGELIYNIRDSSLDVLSGVLGCPVYPRRLITRSVLPAFRIYDESNIICKKLVHEDYYYKFYRAHMLINGEFVDGTLKESRRMGTNEWRNHMFDELRISFLATELHLPMRKILGIVRADHGYVIYDSKPGCDLPRFLDENDEKLDLGMRVKLCRAIASVMSGFLNSDIYSGSVKLENFHVYFVDALPYGRIQLVFTDADDLIPVDRTKPVDSGDFSRMAPEVSWTRLLTPEAGVYSMGLVLRDVLGDISEMQKDPNSLLLPLMEALIKRCLLAKPSERPSMNGIFIELDKLCGMVQHTSQQQWTPI